MDVAAWLREIGLGQYASAFRENDIDASLLPTLTAEELRELGVSSLGHRKRLLAEIAALPARPAAALAVTPERRRLTVMFVDLADSTALSARLDPEDMRAVLRAVVLEEGRELLSVDVRTRYRLGGASTVQAALTALMREDLIVRDAERYVVIDSLMREWVARRTF